MTSKLLITLLALFALVACGDQSRESDDPILQAPIAAPSERGAPQAETPDTSEPDSSASDAIWIAQQVVGGKQCDNDSRFQPPDTRRQLMEAGIEVMQSGREALMVCTACDICPGYAYVHYAQIPEAQANRARDLGFELREPELPLEPDFAASDNPSEPRLPGEGPPRS